MLRLHGGTPTAAINWHRCVPALSEHYRVVAMDLRGHGRGIRPRGRFRLVDCAGDAAALCRHLDTGPVIAVGYSMGGAVAQLLCAEHPEAVEGLVLCATAGLFASPPGLKNRWRLLARGVAQGFRAVPAAAQARLVNQAYRRRRTVPSAWMERERSTSDIRCLIEAGLELDRYDGLGLLPSISVPTAVVKTTRDRVVAPWRQQTMADAIPGAKVIEVEGDHDACGIEDGPFLSALLEACSSVTVTSII